ncbi:phage tail tape measure protein [Bacillus cytotoxicus]
MSSKQVTGKISLMDAMSAPLQRITQMMERTSQAARRLDSSLRLRNTGSAALQQTSKRTTQLTQNSQQLNNTLQQTHQRLNQTSNAMQRTGQNASNASNGMSQLQQRFGGVSERNAQMLNGLERAQGSLLTTGAAATAAGGAIIAGLGASVKTAANFEEAMSKVAAISGASKSQLGQLSEQAKQLGASTKYSASEAAEGMQYLAMAGFKTEEIMKAMPGMLDLAASGALDLGAAADISSNIMSSFGLSADRAGHTADVLAYSASNANTNVSQMGEAMKYAAGTAHTVGFSMEETAAAIMAMGNSGLQGSVAGQAFATSLGRLAKPTKEMKKTMDQLNLSFFDAQGKIKPLPSIVKELEDKTGKMTAQQKSATLTTLFGAEAYKNWAALLAEGSGKLEKNTRALEQADGAASKMAKTMTDNLNGQIIELKSGLEGAAIALGNALLPAIKWVVSGLQGAVSWFNSLSSGTKTTIAVITAIIGIFVSLVGVLGIILAIIPSMVSGFTLLAGAMGLTAGAFAGIIGTTLAVIGVVAAIGVAIVVLYNKCTTFRNIVNSAINGVKSAFDSLMVKVNQVKSFITTAWSGIKAIFGGNTGKGVSILSSIGLSPQTIRSTITIINGVRNAIVRGMSGIMNTVRSIGNGINKFWSQHGQKITQSASKIWNNVKMVVGTVLSGISSVVRTVLTWVANFWNANGTQIMNFVSIAWRGIWTTISTTLSVIGSIVSSVLSAIASFWSAHGSQIMSIVSVAFSVISSVISSALSFISGVFQVVMPIVSGVTQVAFAIIQTVISVAGSVISGVIQVVSNLFHGEWRAAFEAAKQTAVDIWNAITSTFEGIDLFQIGKDIIQGLINGISSMASAAWGAVKDIAGGIKDAVTGFFDIHSPSRVMIELGGFVTEGLAVGIDKNTDMAVKSAVSVSERASMPLLESAITAPEKMSISLVDSNIDEKQHIPFASKPKGSSYTTNNHHASQSTNIKNEFNITISSDAARNMDENEETFKELADKLVNYLADKLDDAVTGKTKINLGVMES